MRGMWSSQSHRLWASLMSVQSEKSFYSYGQNKEQTKWQVCLVDIWSDGKASLIVMAEYDDEADAAIHATQLQKEKDGHA